MASPPGPSPNHLCLSPLCLSILHPSHAMPPLISGSTRPQGPAVPASPILLSIDEWPSTAGCEHQQPPKELAVSSATEAPGPWRLRVSSGVDCQPVSHDQLVRASRAQTLNPRCPHASNHPSVLNNLVAWQLATRLGGNGGELGGKNGDTPIPCPCMSLFSAFALLAPSTTTTIEPV